MQHTKITITEEEMKVMTDTSFLFTKISVISKIKTLLLQLQDEISYGALNMNLPAEIFDLHGKISRGENYKGLPFLILDYPRYFNKKDVFAFRSMFWWGKYFLFTLHLQGTYWHKYRNNILQNLKNLESENIFVCKGNDPWQHDLAENFIPLSDLNEIDAESDFFKISKKVDLAQWQQLPEAGKESFINFMKLSGADNMS